MSCRNCEEIERIEAGEHEHAIARLAHGYLYLNASQYFRGAAFFLARRCVAELHELEPAERQAHLMEMASVAAALQRAVGARKMNYEALGNLVPHLHWWLTPRHADDPRPAAPIWENLDFLRLLWTHANELAGTDTLALRQRILAELQSEPIALEVAYA